MIVLGIDWGTRRIGLAVSWSGEIASPLEVVAAGSSTEETLERIRLVHERVEAEEAVLGVPAGTRHDAAEVRKRFDAIAEALRQKTCKPVHLWDESYSTTEASMALRDAPKSRRKSRTPIDAAAAAVILQSWLDRQKG